MSAQLKGKHIVVIGAGVIGLQTAVTLLEAGAAVTIIAKHVPGDKAMSYTSPWAGAQWRTHATAEDKAMQKWDIESYNTWLDTVEKEKSQPASEPKSGVEKFHSIFYWTAPSPEIPTGPTSAWWAPTTRNFHPLPPTSLPPNIHAGATFTSLTVDPTAYLPHLLSRARALGAHLVPAHLPSPLPTALATATRLLPAYAITTPISAFVNATGIAARDLVPDPAVFPIRGQTVLVRGVARALTTCVRPDGVSYVIPRAVEGTTVLGGTKQVGDWRAEADPETTREILERCRGFAPELVDGRTGGFEVVGVCVGFRPGRTGGPRVEVEVVEGVCCVHEYGHAGAGYQNAVGSAGKVLGLLEGWFGGREGAKL